MNSQRPLSPHLQVYRLPLTGIISISHRITGVALTFGLLVIVMLLAIVAIVPEAYCRVQTLLQWWPSHLVFWGFIYALFFHLCHGVRHLMWDTGKSFDKSTLTNYALYELIASLLLTLATFVGW